ncbi:MAG: helix-hairpin-helix domain-containing protein [Nitrososphaerales archaeon]
MSSINRAGWRGFLGISLFWLAVLAGVLLFTRRPAAQPIEILPPPSPAPTATPVPTATAQPTATPRPLRVDVTGAVTKPQVYTLPPGSIVADAIAAAGGPAKDADLDRVNKATELQDGMQLYVPRQAETPSVPVVSTSQSAIRATQPAVRGGPTLAVLGRINLNTATLAELDTLPEVGPKTAQLIVDGRPYAQVEDLLKVKGIGPATLAKIRDLVTVQ